MVRSGLAGPQNGSGSTGHSLVASKTMCGSVALVLRLIQDTITKAPGLPCAPATHLPITCHLMAHQPRHGNTTVMFKYTSITITSQPTGEPASSVVQRRLEDGPEKLLTPRSLAEREAVWA